jgi:hypothetical protein
MFRHPSKRLLLLWALGDRFLPFTLRVTTIASQRLVNALIAEVDFGRMELYRLPEQIRS